jgi:hypothetical protein
MNRLVHVFAGPSLPPAARPALSDIRFHDPAEQGDLYALVASRPFAIGLIDGYFERVPAVWHKEILWALSQGVHVFGAASLGALRAAELADYGMVGIGRVFAAFSRGELEDDDEVTLVHADATANFRPGSEPMVNIRATFEHAVEQRLLSAEHAQRLIARAKATFYPDRRYDTLLEYARNTMPGRDWNTLSDWIRLPSNRRDVKRDDALELLRAVVEFRDTRPGRKRVPWSFHHTDAWEQVRRGLPVACPDRVEGVSAALASALGALARDPRSEADLRAHASLRAARVELGRRDGIEPTSQDIQAAASELLRRNGVESAPKLRAWMHEQGLDASELERLARDDARASRARLLRAATEDLELLDYLRSRGSLQSPPDSEPCFEAVAAPPVTAETA